MASPRLYGPHLKIYKVQKAACVTSQECGKLWAEQVPKTMIPTYSILQELENTREYDQKHFLFKTFLFILGGKGGTFGDVAKLYIPVSII